MLTALYDTLFWVSYFPDGYNDWITRPEINSTPEHLDDQVTEHT